MRRKFQFVLFVAVAVLASLVAEPALAQRGARQGKPKDQQQGQRMRRGAGKGSMGPRRGAGMPRPWLDRLRAMTPEQQERFFRNNQRFRGMPPERQAQIRENLRRWNTLSPEQKREMREREEAWQRLTPEQRRHIRQEILPRWRQLAPQRRHAIQRRLRFLNTLDESEREARLKDEDFLRGLDSQERDLLRELSRIRLGPPPDERDQPSDEPPL